MSQPPLPIDASLSQVVAAAGRARRLVLAAPPGAGKTTRVPPALLRAGLLAPEHPRLMLLQPRRIAARAAAARIAQEQGWTLGREVGFHVRFERKAGPDTRLLVATEGVLTRRLVADPFLEGIGAVVLDEFHERSLHTDLALALLNEVREAVRDDLIVVVMSATLDAGPVARFLGDCPVIEVEGRSFPVDVAYRPGAGLGRSALASLPDRVAETLESLFISENSRTEGDTLVFLPGWEEIRRTARRLEPLADRLGLLVLPLHGRLSAEEQDRALRPADRPKVVLATNVAETSLTIEGVRSVVDSGLARFASYDPVRGLDRLELGRISRASATQRAGRAGRTGPGRCVRLWSPREDRGMAPFDPPEIQRADLAATALALHAWGHNDPAAFAWFEPPEPEALASAERLLAMLGAIERERGPITPVGRALLAWPVHPRLGRLLLAAAEQGLLRQGAALAALLSEPDIVMTSRPRPDGGAPARAPAARGRSDLLWRLDLLAEAERARFAPSLRDRGIDPGAARQVARTRDELVRIGRRMIGEAERSDADEDALLELVLLAYPDRLARRRGHDELAGVMVGGRGVRLEPESVVREPELFLALDPREDRRPGRGLREARVRIASEVRFDWLEALLPNLVRREREVVFDADRERPVAVQSVWFADLLLREDRNATVAPDEAERALAEAVSGRAGELVAADAEASAWLGRVAFLRRWMPEADWPAFDDAEVADSLAMLAAGKRSLAELRQTSLAPILAGRLTPRQIRLLAAEAPEALTVPGGRRVRLEYAADAAGPPVLAARVQELFGWHDTPRLAAGRVPVLLHILGPNYRPVQITDDLRSFWSTTYFQVRKDLRARYPRHRWPEDPLASK